MDKLGPPTLVGGSSFFTSANSEISKIPDKSPALMRRQKAHNSLGKSSIPKKNERIPLRPLPRAAGVWVQNALIRTASSCGIGKAEQRMSLA